MKIKILSDKYKEPVKGSKFSACWDVYAASKNYVDNSNKIIKYGLGFAAEIPVGYKAILRPRSSIYKTGLVLSNSEGIIDSDYRGEWGAVFYNVVPSLPEYEVGDRIVQMEIVPNGEFIHRFGPVESLSETARGAGGYGSTGMK